MSANREVFSIQVKSEVWKRDCHPAEPRICQCCTCETIVSCPFEVHRHLNLHREKIPYKKIHYGQYRSLPMYFWNQCLISGPRVIIQCPDCFRQFKQQQLHERHLYTSDQYMVYLKNK